jgi:UDP-N-acetylmuramoyl-L-alanyl-D-glutamate--2,6-diaminopimelate ligase
MDDEYSRLAYQLSSCEKRSFGVINFADAYATEIHTSMQENSFYYRESSLIFKATTHIGGVFNVYNTLAALKCVIDIGIKPCIAKRAITAIETIDGRMELRNGRINVVIDYAHTPNSFLNCIKTLKQNINIKQKLILVFGCGGDRDVLKRPVFGHYAELYADKIIITEDNSRTESFYDIANDIMKGMTKKTDKIIEDRESAIRYALLSASEGDVVALIGKGHEKYKIIGSEYVPFDERQIVDSILSKMEDDYENKP